jgi:hypothetical protein
MLRPEGEKGARGDLQKLAYSTYLSGVKRHGETALMP